MKIDLTLYILSDHHGLKLDISNRNNKAYKPVEPEQLISEQKGVKTEIKKFETLLELSENKNTTALMRYSGGEASSKRKCNATARLTVKRMERPNITNCSTALKDLQRSFTKKKN